MHLGEFICKFTFPENSPVVQEEMAMFSFFGIPFMIETMIFDRNYMVIIFLNCTRGNGNVLMI